MKKPVSFFILLFILFIGISATAQVAVNTSGNTPHPSAILDVNSADKGLLIPRVVLTSLGDNINPVNNPAVGLLVFNTGGALASGFYFWDGNLWANLASMDQVVNVANSTGEAAFGEIYEFNAIGSYSNISVPAAGSWTQWTSGAQGDLYGMTCSGSTLVADSPGVYSVTFNTSSQVPSGGKIVEVALFVNDVIQNDLRSRTWYKEGGKAQNIVFSGLIELDMDDVLTVKFSQNDNGIIRLETANLSVNQIN